MTVGILGGGQLARMIALAGIPLGQEFIVLDPSAEAGAVRLSRLLQGAYDDPALLEKMAQQASIVTYEFENVPASAAEYLTAHTTIYPPAKALQTAQDRLVEKQHFQSLGIQTAPFAAVDNLNDLTQAMSSIGYPAILKSRRMGYDGKGQVVIQSAGELADAWQAMQDAPSIVEGFIPFQREVSIIAVRRANGDTVFYPLSENTHKGGILRVAHCQADDPQQIAAENYVSKLMESLDYVGTIALELFDVNGQLIANEFAPRVHNSGHWTIEGSETSQFENHLRAILDLPLGSTQSVGYSAMVNFIGDVPPEASVLAIPHAHLHLYDKLPRKGRKVAHATIRCDDERQFNDSLNALHALATQFDDS
ncbi:5-(carboxyamino)imidazole ribonucleotide synthase [methane-oxidizing endosymbiont of Gigantopelta aegis]|uniref:5-(carboxyamino)imidazole ribonucleotide synthase n=1 Tax=methane-oxidizing endosymbiont of Gigantopelta aegis TaxID=2794938 RepID=UPI0018DB09B7|nr:5-(carboxyamino)imidazole ribonucleotide synthase [methane-oxidizing endosymbiont of Gigantopelta aegis]